MSKPSPSRRISGLVSIQELEFLANFFGIFALLFTFIHYLSMAWLLDLLASTEAAIISSLGVNAVATGAQIWAGGIWFQIVPECTGLVMGAMLVALAYSTNVRHRFNVVAAFVPLLLAFNIIRLALTIYLGTVFGQTVLDWVHYSLWFVDTGVVFCLWMLCVSKTDPLDVSKGSS